ncbi:hypothetical protein GXM_05160 [Nostoc sphaeroides CCNUC1]|uniref:Uncharacterized protein n=1 Tax=Nostoc sphaeroides CCNUC1 TaxID=2653204 RepID=A0A5P8W4J9_9NOSO|nr:hypothetical protein GXM_05160 [Nostoc sphaeroides CCNUC1]
MGGVLGHGAWGMGNGEWGMGKSSQCPKLVGGYPSPLNSWELSFPPTSNKY